jgi:hypothetical protein
LAISAPGATLSKLDGFPGALRAKFSKRTQPVSFVIPTAFNGFSANHSFVETLVRSLLPFVDSVLGDEIVLVHGGEDQSGIVEKIVGKNGIFFKSIQDEVDFNFSRRCNIGFLSARNEHVLLLNDDIEFGDENPLDSLFGILSLPNVGLVGALLVFPDFSIQHGGHAFTEGLPHHAHYESRSLVAGLMDLAVDHEVVGVTGAFMFQLKSTWESVGGFSELFPLNYNDVDYCQKIRTLGFTIIQANSVQAIHHESVTRVSVVEEEELALVKQRWADVLNDDQYSTI